MYMTKIIPVKSQTDNSLILDEIHGFTTFTLADGTEVTKVTLTNGRVVIVQEQYSIFKAKYDEIYFR